MKISIGTNGNMLHAWDLELAGPSLSPAKIDNVGKTRRT